MCKIELKKGIKGQNSEAGAKGTPAVAENQSRELENFPAATKPVRVAASLQTYFLAIRRFDQGVLHTILFFFE